MRALWLPGSFLLLGCAGLFGAEDTADDGTNSIFDAPDDTDDGGNGGDDDGGADPDDDGLTNDEEDELGTDPDEADSDGDGVGDGEELDQNTDPLDEDDAPYEGGWAKDACRSEVEGEGWREGDVSDNFVLSDQFGEDVSLHDFCDRTIYLVFAAFW